LVILSEQAGAFASYNINIIWRW